MFTGHCCSQARQVVQPHSTSSCMMSGTRLIGLYSVAAAEESEVSAAAFSVNAVTSNLGRACPSFRNSSWREYKWLRRSSVKCLGLSTLPVVVAGQLSEQRPHSVQVSKSRM